MDVPKAKGPDGRDLATPTWKLNGKVVWTTEAREDSRNEFVSLVKRKQEIMVLLGRKHLHVSESNQIVDSLFKILNSVTSGSVKLEVANQPVLKVEINRNSHLDGDGQ